MMTLREDDEEAEAPELGCVFQIGGVSRLAGFDTWAEVSGGRRSIVGQDWRVLKRSPKKVKGLGPDEKQVGQLVTMPVQIRYGAPVVHTLARVFEDEDLPEGVDMLIGTEAQKGMRAVIDCGEERIALESLGMVMNLESIDVLMERSE